MTISLGVAIAIFLAISVRQWLPHWIRIWQIMLAGAIVLLVLGEISPQGAFRAIDWNVIVYLFGVFSIASALYDSGLPETVARRIARSEGDRAQSLLLFFVIAGVSAVFLTNDAAAVIGTPIALSVARAHRIQPTIPLIALCVVVNIAGMSSPVGNPQNILIVADGHFTNAVGAYALWLAVPAFLSLMLAYAWLLFCLRRELPSTEGIGTLPEPTRQKRWPAFASTALLTLLILADSLLHRLHPGFDLPLGVIALAACAPVYLFSPQRVTLLRSVDWYTLTFFIAMFIVTGSVLDSGALQDLLGSWRDQLASPPVVATIGFWASQLFSNVPVVEIYLNLLKDPDPPTLMLLAAMATLASNLFVISAASNVIVVQQAEKFGAEPFTFWRFTLLALPVSIVSVAITYGWIVGVVPRLIAAD